MTLLDAAVKIRYEEKQKVWGTLVNWLKSDQWHHVPRQYIVMAKEFSEKGAISDVLKFLRVVLFPRYSKSVLDVASIRPSEAVGRFSCHRLETVVKPLIMGLKKGGRQKCIILLEHSLSRSLKIETINRGNSFATDMCLSGVWRDAIEDHKENLHPLNHKDFLLLCLRDLLKKAVDEDKDYGVSIITRYQSHRFPIYNRIAMYLISELGGRFKELAIPMLMNTDKLSDDTLSHEMLVMLQAVFPFLNEDAQKAIVEKILCGPNSSEIHENVVLLQEFESDNFDAEAYRKRYVGTWIRDRLQVIEGFLKGDSKDKYKKMIGEYGKAECSGSKRSYFVRSAPISEEDWERKSVSDCLDFMIAWEPESHIRDLNNIACPDGLAKLFSSSLLLRWEQFQPGLARLVERSKYPCYTSAILICLEDYFVNVPECDDSIVNINDSLTIIECSIVKWINVSRLGKLLEYGDPRAVLLEALRVIEKLMIWIESKKPEKWKEFLDRIRDILVGLCDHNDAGGQVGTEAEDLSPKRIIDNSKCHIRPMALRGLLRYAVVRAKLSGTSLPRWENTVRDKATELLSNKNCLAVLAVFGETWIWLYWLDEGWGRGRHQDIFPVDDSKGKQFIVTSSAYMFHMNGCGYNDPGYDLMKPLYIAAINYSLENTTERFEHFNRQLAMRLAGLYYLDIEEYPTEDPMNPLNHLFSFAPNPLQAYFAETLCEVCADANDKKMRDSVWKKTMKLWRGRLQCVKKENRNEYFSEELVFFLNNLNIVELNICPSEVSDLLDLSIEYIKPDQMDNGIDYILEYLASIANENSGFAVLRLKLLLDAHGVDRYIDQQHIETILTGVSKSNSEHARTDALEIVHLLGQSGHYWAKACLDDLRK